MPVKRLEPYLANSRTSKFSYYCFLFKLIFFKQLKDPKEGIQFARVLTLQSLTSMCFGRWGDGWGVSARGSASVWTNWNLVYKVPPAGWHAADTEPEHELAG